VLILALMLLPKTPLVLYAFGFGMGLLWLSTVPLTNGLVAADLRPAPRLDALGTVFFGHQIGSFCGAWLGGVIFTRNGSYDMAWWIAMALGILAAILTAPIDEKPIARVRAGARGAVTPRARRTAAICAAVLGFARSPG
jgi:predicted MFS family arabinose efflux permease